MGTATRTAPASPAGSGTVWVPLAAIVEDTRVWPRAELDGERVKEFSQIYTDEAGALPPVQLAPMPAELAAASNKTAKAAKGASVAKASKAGTSSASPRYLIVDGWHRIAAKRKAAKGAKAGADKAQAPVPAIPAIIRADLATLDAIYMEAVRLSSTSAKPLSSREKRAAVRRILAAHPSMSDRDVANLAGCSHMTVNRQRNPLRRGLSRLGDALTDPTGAGQTSTRTTLYIEGRLALLMLRPDADELTAENLAECFATVPEARPVAARWAAILYSAAHQATGTDA